jgi:hypothetical protein
MTANLTTKRPPLNTDTIWAIINREIDDDTVNQTIWYYLGYRYDEKNQTWDTSQVDEYWVRDYPEPPNFLATRPPSVKLNRSIPKENRQLVKRKLGFKGYKLGEFSCFQARRVIAANWLLNYMESHRSH